MRLNPKALTVNQPIAGYNTNDLIAVVLYVMAHATAQEDDETLEQWVLRNMEAIKDEYSPEVDVTNLCSTFPNDPAHEWKPLETK